MKVHDNICPIFVMARRQQAPKSPLKKGKNLRNRYSIRERIAAMKWCAKKKALGWSQRQCAGCLGLSPKSLCNWQKQYKEMMEYKLGVLLTNVGAKS